MGNRKSQSSRSNKMNWIRVVLRSAVGVCSVGSVSHCWAQSILSTVPAPGAHAIGEIVLPQNGTTASSHQVLCLSADKRRSRRHCPFMEPPFNQQSPPSDKFGVERRTYTELKRGCDSSHLSRSCPQLSGLSRTFRFASHSQFKLRGRRRKRFQYNASSGFRSILTSKRFESSTR